MSDQLGYVPLWTPTGFISVREDDPRVSGRDKTFTVEEFLPGDMPRVGVLSPGDRLLVVIDPKTTRGYVEHLVQAFQRELPGVPILVVAATGVIIDKTGASS